MRDVEISTRNAAMVIRYKATDLFRALCMRIVSHTDSVTLCGILQTMRNAHIPTETAERAAVIV